MSEQQISKVSYGHPVLKWLLLGSQNNSIPFAIAKGSQVESQNSNSEDIKTDQKLAQLLTKDGIVRAASVGNRGNVFLYDTHFSLRDGKVYTIHIYGDSIGITSTGVYLPNFFDPPIYTSGDTVIAVNKAKQVLGIAHLRVSSQAEVTRNYNSGKKNALGSRYIGDLGGLGGDGACYRHSHLYFFPNAAARERIKTKKAKFLDPELNDSKDLLDIRDLLKLSPDIYK